jgi:hypothetical protein
MNFQLRSLIYDEAYASSKRKRDNEQDKTDFKEFSKIILNVEQLAKDSPQFRDVLRLWG